jgi:hypothetical protein
MNKLKITLGSVTLIMAAVAIVACSKEKTAQQETPAVQQTADPNDLTLSEMSDAISWEDGKAFFENQPFKDYTYACEMLLNDCGFAEREAGLPFVISWVLKVGEGICDPDLPGTCLVIRKKENSSIQANAMGYFEDGKLVIIPTTENNGFTADGYLVVGSPIEIQNDSIVIQSGIYVAYYDEETGCYTAVAVDYYSVN